MSLLESIRPTKRANKFELTAFSDDIELFLGAIDYLSKNSKEKGKFEHETLFEHLMSPLRGDKSLQEFMNKGKRRGSTKKVVSRDSEGKNAPGQCKS